LRHLAPKIREAPDQQISLSDPDSRSMATRGRGSGVVGYNMQVAVDTEHHLIVAHDVINIGNDRGQLARMSQAAKERLQTEALDVVADRSHFDGNEILGGTETTITVTLPKPMTSGAKADGRFGGGAGRAGEGERTSRALAESRRAGSRCHSLAELER
jgi:hypothetical protein